VKRKKEKGKPDYFRADLIYTPKLKDWMSWKTLQRSSVMEGKAGNKTSDVEMIRQKRSLKI